MCAPVMVELEGETDPLQIAMKELKYALSFFVFLPYPSSVIFFRFIMLFLQSVLRIMQVSSLLVIVICELF